jgi:hypothetical protein
MNLAKRDPLAGAPASRATIVETRFAGYFRCSANTKVRIARRCSRVVAVGFTLVLVWLVVVPKAFGSCACLGTLLTVEEHKAHYDLIARASVIEVDNASPIESSVAERFDRAWPPTRVQTIRLRVGAVWKGPRREDLVLVSDASDRRCLLVPVFKVGREYLVFAERKSNAWWIGSCNVSMPIASVRPKWTKGLGEPEWQP